MNHAKERLRREEEQQLQYQQEIDAQENLRLVVGQFQTFAEHIATGLQETDLAARRQLLRLLIKRIEIDIEEVRIVCKVQPHPFALSPASRGFLQHCLKSAVTSSR